VEKLRRVRAARDHPRVERALAAVADASRGRDNLMPHILEAVRAYASVGEICGTLRQAFGEYREGY
jgi:methylmalonyl-CoA mutase N-terminal domain/subunit